MAEQKLEGRIRSLKLTGPQWDVAEAIRQRLEDAAPWITARNERLESARERYHRPLSSATRVLPLDAPPGFADVDQERYDRALLIDGHRGEGKTSVLMKMLDTWNLHALSRLDRQRSPVDRAKKKAKSKARDGSVQLPEGVFVVPLPTLDLPAMPRGHDVPLASLVLNCFSSLVSELVDDRRKHSVPSREREPEAAPESLRDRWDWLHRSLASKYSHASKRQRDDALQHARELQDDTRRVYEIDDRFRLFIDTLSDEVKRRFGLDAELPVFVIAIDDLDLAAHATTDLLDVLRVFQHPAVYFVMTGDYENLHRCVRNAPSMLSLFSNLPTEADDYRFGRSALASDIVERIFPRHNVLRLESPKLDERLTVEWSRGQQVGPLLKKLAKRVPLLGGAAESSDGEQLGRLGLVLPTRLRRLVNLCERLSALAEDDRDDIAVEVAHEFWRAALAERGLEYPKGIIRELFERRVDKHGNPRLTVTELRADSLPGEGALVIERAGKRFELSRLARPVKPLLLVNSEGNAAHPELLPVASLVLEMSARGVEPEIDGLPHFFNRSLVRTTFLRERTVYQLDWPLPAMTVEVFERLRRTWTAWLNHAYIATAITDGKLSVIELYVLALGWVIDGAGGAWVDLVVALAAADSRASAMLVLHDLRERAWKRLYSEFSQTRHKGPLKSWASTTLMSLCTERGWDTATSDAGVSVLREIARSNFRSSAEFMNTGTLLVRPGFTWTQQSVYLLNDGWEVNEGIVAEGEKPYNLFDRVVSVKAGRGAPLESMTIAKYLDIDVRRSLRDKLSELMQRRVVMMKVAALPQEVGIRALLAELSVFAGYMDEKVNPLSPELPADFKAAVDRGPAPDAGALARLKDASGYYNWPAHAPFWALMTDIWIDSGLIDPPLLDFPVPGLLRWDGVQPSWVVPAFQTVYDQQLLAQAWQNGLGSHSTRIDALFLLVTIVDQVWSSRMAEVYSSGTRRVPVSSFVRALRDMEMRRVEVNSERSDSFGAFLGYLPVFAHPSLGLSLDERELWKSIVRGVRRWTARQVEESAERQAAPLIQYRQGFATSRPLQRKSDTEG